MKIGIIGSGNIGGSLTRRLRSLGHDVRDCPISGLRREALLIRVEVEDLRRLPRRGEGVELGAVVSTGRSGRRSMSAPISSLTPGPA
jgi:hypothetical protein